MLSILSSKKTNKKGNYYQHYYNFDEIRHKKSVKIIFPSHHLRPMFTR